MSNILDMKVDWQDSLAANTNGTPYANELNVITALERAPELRGIVAYNEFADDIEIVKPPPWQNSSETWSDIDRIELQAWLQANGLNITRASVVQDAVITVARRAGFNPVADYLNGLEWDKTPRLDTWLQHYMGAVGDSDYLAAIGPRIMVGAVARIEEPGCKLDTVPVFEGPQGLGKSRGVAILGSPWNADGVPDLHTKDAAIQIQGVWLVELEELASMSRADVEHVKAFLSRTTDRYRPPYGRNAINRPRRCAFIATTNLQDYLKDETGNSRFWPIRCRDIRCDLLQADKSQLWAEAMHLYKSGYQWHLTDNDTALAEREQEARRLVPELESDLLDYLDRELAEGTTLFTCVMLRHVAGIHDFSKDRYHAGAIGQQFSRTLTRHGWEKLRPIGRGPQRRQPYEFTATRNET